MDPRRPRSLAPWILLTIIASGIGIAIHPVFGALCVATFGGLTARARSRDNERVASALLGESYQAMTAGQLNVAEGTLDLVDARSSARWVKRMSAIQRGTIALRRGDVAGARAHLERAVAIAPGRFESNNAHYQIEGAHSLLAFACASLGDREGAERELRWIRGRGGASPDALAKASLAEAMLADKAGDRAALKRILDQDRTLLFEHTHPRERAIVRAYQRMLRVATSTVYRASGQREDESKGDEPPLQDWVAKVAPAAAPFVRVGKKSAVGAPGLDAATYSPATTPWGRQAVEAARAGAPRARKTIVGFVVLAVIGYFGLTALPVLIGAASTTTASGGAATAIAAWIGVALASLAVLGVPLTLGARALKRRRNHRRTKAELGAARAAVLAGDDASAGLSRLEASETANVAAEASLLRTFAAERAGNFEEMVIAATHAASLLAGSNIAPNAALWAEIIAARSFALAALGRPDEADAELAALPPMYPHRGRAVFRVRLAQLLGRNDLVSASAWVEGHAADLPLSVREELLADLARAVASPETAGLGELDRLREELRNAANRRWIQAIAPRLLGAFEGTEEPPAPPAPPPRKRVEIPVAAPMSPELEAELEAMRAEAENEAKKRFL
jgi:hypothetical protein